MNNFNSKQRFGIRKIHGITGSVLLGLLVFSMATLDNVSANEVSDVTSVTSLVSNTDNVINSAELKEVDSGSETVTKPKVKQYNPKWDTVDESGNVVRDLNKYSDTEANKLEESENPDSGEVDKPDSGKVDKPDSDEVDKPDAGKVIKPVDKESFTFKTTWEDDSTEDKNGDGSNLMSNSLVFTYSNTEAAENLYVTISKDDRYNIIKSSQSEYVGSLKDGRSVYKISYLNGASQVEFKSDFNSTRKDTTKKSGKVISFDYSVYQVLSPTQNTSLQTMLDNSTKLYSGRLTYTYDKLKYAGYTITDKLNSVVNTNIEATDGLRKLDVVEYSAATGKLIRKSQVISVATGLNNAEYSKSFTYGRSAYEFSFEYETPNHERETITVSGIPEGLTPVVNHKKLADGSYKIDMRDLLLQPHGSTTIDFTMSDELANKVIENPQNFKPEYRLERLNDDGTQFIQVVKDPYGFILHPYKKPEGELFEHSVVNLRDEYTSIDRKISYGEYVSLVDAKHEHIPMVARYQRLLEGSNPATVVYDLQGIDAHFNKVSNTDSTVYAYVNGAWVEVSNDDKLREVILPANTKKVALSHDGLSKGDMKSPKFDVSLDNPAKFLSENKNVRTFLDLHARVFFSPSVVTYMDDSDIDKEGYILAERVLLLPKEKWAYNIKIESSRYPLPFERGTTAINVRTNWETDGPSDVRREHPTTHVDYFVHLSKDVAKLNPKFDKSVTVLSESKVDDGVVYRISFNTSETPEFKISIDSDGITPVNGKVTVGKIDDYPGQDSNRLISESGSTYPIGGSKIDFGHDLKGKHITESSAIVEFKALREIFSKLEILEQEPTVDSVTKQTTFNYNLVGSVNDYTGTGKAIKNAIFGIPKTRKGTILNLSKVLENQVGVLSYSYELDNSGTFTSSIQPSELSKVTKVKVTYDNAVTVTAENPWVFTIPLVVDEKSKDTKEAIGTLSFEYSDDTSLVTNNVQVRKAAIPREREDKKPSIPKERKDFLKFQYFETVVSIGNYDETNPLYKPNRFEALKKYLQEHHTEVIPKNGENGLSSHIVGRLGDESIVKRIYTGTMGKVTLNAEDIFEYVYDKETLKGKIKEIVPYHINPEPDGKVDPNSYEANTNYVLQAIVKVDKNGNESFLRKGETFTVSDIDEIRVYYTPYTKIKSRGYIYTSRVDNPDDYVRNNPISDEGVPIEDFMRYEVTSNMIGKPLYNDDVEGLTYGSSAIVKPKEIPSRTEVEENDRFKRTVTYSYTYHPLKDIDGYKDDGTRLVAYNGTSTDLHAVFFYDEHVDEKIEWKTNPLNVRYIDIDTGALLTSYQVQRLKDEPIGDFDREYPSYTFIRADFEPTELMGDSERTVNLYFKHQKATVRTEIYVDDVLVSTKDKEVDTLSPVDKSVSDQVIEHENKVAKYIRTESDGDFASEDGSIVTVKHYYETVREINDVEVNVVFKYKDTVVGSTLADSGKQGNDVDWNVLSSTSDIVDIVTYKPLNGTWEDLKLTGKLPYEEGKRIYTVEIPVTKRVGRIIVNHKDESGVDIIPQEVYKEQPVGTPYDKILPSTKIPFEQGYVNKDGKLYLRTTSYIRVTKDDFGPGTLVEGDNVFTFVFKKATKDIEPNIVGKIPNDAPKVEIPEYNEPIGISGVPEVHEKLDFIGGVVPLNPPIVTIPEYLEPVGTVPNDAPKLEIPEFEGGVVPNDAPKVEIPSYDEPVGTVPDGAPKVEIPEFDGGIPGIPEIHENPEYMGGVIPNNPPTVEFPEFKGGVVPNDAPKVIIPSYDEPIGISGTPEVHEKPSYDRPVEVVPNDAPKVTIPEFNGGVSGIPEVHEKLDYNKPIGLSGTPEVHEKPEYEGGVVPNDAPIQEKPEYVETISSVKETMLPNTGGADSSIFSLLGGLSLTSILGFVFRQRKEE
jgi:LPXTG-motif cell wall-anchored protein